VTFLKENVCFGKKSNAYQRGEELKGKERRENHVFLGIPLTIKFPKVFSVD